MTFLAQLSPVLTSTGDLITPILAYFDKSNYKPELNPDEVEDIFEITSERFLSNENHRFELMKLKDEHFFCHFFDDTVNGKVYTTWGATALISIVVSAIIHMRAPEFVVDPQMNLTNENILKYLDDYLLIKSNKLIDVLSNIRKNGK